MLAVRTGIRYDVFDFDTQNGGYLAEFLAYTATLGNSSLAVQAVCATPSGGYHLYVNALDRRKTPIARGVDYQGNLGIAFIPPSRKLSKLTDTVTPYRWIDYAPGGSDSGEEIYQALVDWPDHRPQPKAVAKSRGGDGHRGLTRSQLQQYRREGLSDADNHDDTLRDIVWSLCMWQSSEEYALEVWQDVVDRTEPKSGRRPFEPRDFDRHWRGAERKLRGAP